MPEASDELKTTRDILEACLSKAVRADHQDAPFPMDATQAKIWHDAQANAYRHALEMLPSDALARLREAAPAEEVEASHAIIVDIKHQIERLDLADDTAREDAAETIIAQVETLISRINTAERERNDYQARVIPAETRVVELEHRLLELADRGTDTAGGRTT